VIRLCYSNRTEALCEALAENLGAERSSLFDPVHLVVPNPLVEGYVKQALARRLGIAAHIETRFLRGFLKQIANASAPEVPIVDRDLCEGELLALFSDPARLVSRDLDAVRGYLAPSGSARDHDHDDEGLDRRRVQLASQVAALFDEYAFSRPEMLATWRRGALAPDLDEPLQRWQRELWLALFGRGGTFAARGALTLPDFFAQVETAALRPPPAAHVFGISYVARLYRSIFGSIARASALFVYTLNPCREYWEDLALRRRGAPAADARRFPRRRGGAQLSLGGIVGLTGMGGMGELTGDVAERAGPAENPLLELWGRPGRDNMRLLNQLADCDFEARFVDPTAETPRPSLLATLQKEVLDREPAGQRPAADGSLVILPAPDPRRELETVAAEIWSLLRADRTLTFADVAVIVPPAAAPTYLPLARAVFGEASALPHTIVDLPRTAELRIRSAVTQLLDLPNGPLSRPDLLGLAMHPAVARRFPEIDPDRWVALCEALEIVRGADRDDHADSYLDRDGLSWDQGLRRLALGAFLSGRRSGEERPFAMPGGRRGDGAGDPSDPSDRILPAELPAGLEPAARALGMLARGFIAYARAAEAHPATFATFAALLRRTITATILPAAADEEAALGDALAAIERVAALVPPKLEMSFRTAAELVKSRLDGGPGHHRTPEGVTVASFVPMRALPFRIIFVIGLDERVFPAPDGLAAIDLRAGQRLPGDVTPREQDEYMFLETLLSARDRIYLSYVARDAVSGERKNPCSTIAALLDGIAPGALSTADPEAAAPGLIRPVAALARHRDDAACAVIPAAARERLAAALGQSARRAAGNIVQLPGLAAVREALDPAAWRAAAARLDWVGPPPGTTAAVRRTPTLTDLRRFLECPLQASARILLPLRDDDEAADEAEAALREHERLDEARLHTVPLLRGVLLEALAGSGSIWAADAALRTADAALRAADAALRAADAVLVDGYDRAAAVGRLDGTLPAGLFGRAIRARHLRLLTCWRDGLFATLGRDFATPAALWLGAAPEHRPDLAPLPAIDVPLPGGATLALGGRTELCAETADGGRAVIALIASTGFDLERDLLRPFFTHLALAARGQAGDSRESRAILIRPEKDGTPRVDERVFPAISATDARAHLGDLAGGLLGRIHDYFLPCEAVFTWKKRRDKGESIGVRDAVLLLRDDNWTRFLSERGPVPDSKTYPVPTEALALEMVTRRFGPYFAALGGPADEAGANEAGANDGAPVDGGFGGPEPRTQPPARRRR
jgi:exodeoxyribonuclease V gamma subunit